MASAVVQHRDPEGHASARGLAAWLLMRAGLDPADYRAAPLDRRVPACLRALKVDSEAAARLRLRANPALVNTALDVFLIGLTDFFRDTDVFDVLRRDVIPALAALGSPLRVWSAGCSNGAELHSVAILFSEAGLLDRARLVGTDCRASAIEAGRLARYTAASLACVPPATRDRYFTRDGNRRRLIPALRERLDWRVRDVLLHCERGPWHLVLCRNLTIYLAPQAAHRLTESAVAALAPGGFIVVGRAERLPAIEGLTQVARCVYRKAL
jgi:chemotaxis methyl-accepting protein methylase